MNDIKKDFPLLLQESISYLDSASTTQKPQQVLDAIQHAYSTYNANPGRGIYRLAEEATEQYEGARSSVAQFIGAQPNEIIFTANATAGINLIAQGWARQHLKPGDEILLTELEHHSNLLPWQRVAQETGAQLKFIPIFLDGSLDMSVLDSLLTERTKLVACTQSSNAIGTQVDIVSIVARAKQMGARTLIDACQVVPHQKINVSNMGCDFLVFSGHKLLGPTGIGVLYIKESMQEVVEPLSLGGGQPFQVDWHQYTLRKGPHKFEAGTPPFIQAMGLIAAIEYIQQNIPFDALREHEAKVCARLIDGFTNMKNITILGPIDQLKTQGHLITFVVEGMHPHDVAAYLDSKGVAVRAGYFCAQPLFKKLGYDGAIRASFYCYSQEDDIDQLLQALHQLSE
jgi:cysteine desulfurase/selenocysteine lyase